VAAQSTLMRRLLQLYLIILAAGLPLVVPKLPGNTAMVDYANLAFFVPLIFCLLFAGRIETRALPGILLILFASILSSVNSDVLALNLTTLAQEAYLVALMLILLNVLDDEREVLFLLRCWFLTACVIGGMALSEVLANPTVRARATFDNPNMTSSYLGTGVCLMFVPRVLPSRFVAIPAGLLILGGVFATKSMSALLGVGASSVVVFALAWSRSTARQKGRLAVVAALALMAATAVLPRLLAEENYANRMDNSAGGRSLIWKAGIQTFLENPFGIGIGPAGFASHAVITGGPFKGGERKELHSDYLSFLVERGVIGFLGLLVFLGGFGLLLWNALFRTRDPVLFQTALALSGMFAFQLVDALSHEMLHYRHVWVLFGLIAAQERLVRRRAAQGALRAAPLPGPARARIA
jgi:O-antigen ligase